MYGDNMRSEGENGDQPVAPPEPTTAKKRHVLGRSNSKNSRMEPLRINSMLPELNQLWDTAKKERRSHGTSYSKNEGHEWLQTNNTIPETLSSSREWNMQGFDDNHAVSQNDLRPSIRVTEATPIKSYQFSYSKNAPVVSDKENLYTPQKAPEPAVLKTPAQNRCPLSALPMDTDPVKGALQSSDSNQLPEASSDHFQSSHSNESENNLLGSSKETNFLNYDSEGFRTPQCKMNVSQPKIVPQSRQRLFGISSRHCVPLHPAVAAGQQQAKQLQQHQQQQQHQPSTLPHDPLAPRKFCESTPLKSIPSSVVASSVVTPYKSVHNSAAASSEITPFKSAPRPITVASRQTPVHPSQSKMLISEKKPSSSSSWLPQCNIAAQGKSHIPSYFDKQQSCGPSQVSAKRPLENDPQQVQRKLEPQDIAKPLPPHNQDFKQYPPQSASRVLPEPCKDPIPRPVSPVESAKSSQGENKKSQAHNQDLKQHLPQSALRVMPEPCKDPLPKPVSPVEGAKSSQCENKKSQALTSTDSAQRTSGHQVTVNGKSYTILSLLGRGGSSKVFQVLDPDTSQLKAVKCVNLADTDQSICEGYLNEIKLLADLQDGDCVIRMFDHEHQKQNQTLFVVMEKGDTDLSKLIKEVNKSKKISAAMIVYYWTEMLNAVSFIHRRGTIHSDLKPANFLLVSGRLKLIDFGIASSVQEDMTSVVKDNMTGTYNYISPEALSNTSADGQLFKIGLKSDVWSLGCILYNLVYGRTPFQHIPNQFQKLSAIVNPSHRIQFPEPSIEGCPSVLIQAMKACLVRNPKERASVDDLLQLPYFEQAVPERGILSQIASLVASVGLSQEGDNNPAASVVRSIQRLIIENERDLSFLRQKR